MDLHEAIAKALTTVPHTDPSRRSSTASSKGVPVSDSDTNDDAKPATKVRV